MKNNEQPIPSDASIKAERIYFAAVEIEDANERTAFIEKSCIGNDAVRQKVETLFSLQDQATEIFETNSPTRITASEIAHSVTAIPEFFENMKAVLPDDDEVGKQIGNYKLLQKIGEGGVGIVYLAEQTRPVRRQVALKIIKAGMDTKSVIARFEAERQALAMMEHPNIARVFNAGETETGRPYFVMELVQGERITTYCDEHQLNIRQRLELFMQVCHAIQHAHQKGIIHRDIKPSNVLVTQHDGEPSPVVIDFGIAKAAGENMLTDKTLNTSVGPIIGTPAYMSPEQTNLQQANIDTRSDIYSLGVLLYELLISKPPFDHKELLSAGLDEMCRILREMDPPLPVVKFQQMDADEQDETLENRGIEFRRLSHALAGDLTWITMKAMEKDRERRYESAGELAAEIQRFMNDEPVLACPPSQLYRFKKMVRRNKAVSISAATITLTLVACLAALSWMYLRERDARHREQQLRLASEDRERITQAAFLISHGNYEEADQFVKKVSAVTPSLETESVLRTLGEWHAVMGQWSESADRFRLLLKADINDNSWNITDDLLKAGPVLIEQGDVRGYEGFRQAAIAMYQHTEEYVFAERTLKVSILLPVDRATLNDLQPVEDVLAKACQGVTVFDGMRAWGAMSLALMEYRKGDWTATIDWSERCRNSDDQHPVRTAISQFIQAMALCKLGNVEEAQTHFRLGQIPVDAAFSKPLEIGTMEDGFWYDWLYARILMREAESSLP